MMHQSDMRDLRNRVMAVNRVYHLTEIYELVECNGNLDSEDLSLSGMGTNNQPRWKETVRKALDDAQNRRQVRKTSPRCYVRLKQLEI